MSRTVKHPDPKHYYDENGTLDTKAFDEDLLAFEDAEYERLIAIQEDIGDQIHEQRRDEPNGGCDDE